MGSVSADLEQQELKFPAPEALPLYSGTVIESVKKDVRIKRVQHDACFVIRCLINARKFHVVHVHSDSKALG